LPSLHGSHLDDSVKEFFRVFKEHSRELWATIGKTQFNF
jgi:hypothetical protein